MAVRLWNTELAVQLYYSTPEIGNKETAKLFGCASATATKKLKEARELQAARNIRTTSERVVNTKIAYEAWNIDIADLEKMLVTLKKLQKKGDLA